MTQALSFLAAFWRVFEDPGEAPFALTHVPRVQTTHYGTSDYFMKDYQR